ncbi:MAG TPA: PH domain-containing protein [Phototrophicaceae bacterium]|nr:PH domain-containing protein [Phototrophicaceae bacterium]
MATNKVTTNSSGEAVLGVWHESKAHARFWLMCIVTLSLYYWLVYKHNNITVTHRRVTQKLGNAINSNEVSLAIEHVTDVDINIGLLGRIFNYGDVSIQTAGSAGAEMMALQRGNKDFAPHGEAGSASAEIIGLHIANPHALRDTIFNLLDGNVNTTSKN